MRVAKKVTVVNTDSDVKIGYAAAIAASNDTKGNARLMPGTSG